MKLEIETPTHLIDVNGLAARPDRGNTGKAACGSARWCATPISPPTRACDATIRCCRARCSPAPRASCATRRRPPAICCSAPAAPISTTRTKPCNKRQPGTGCAAIGGYTRNLAILGASDACIATHPSDMAVAMRALDATVETVRAGRQHARHPDRRLPSPARRDAARRDGARAGRTDHRRRAAAAGRGRAGLSQGARPGVLAFALVSVGAIVQPDGAGRVALGGVAPKPWRVEAAEAALPHGAKAVPPGCSPTPSRRTRTSSRSSSSSGRSARFSQTRGPEP